MKTASKALTINILTGRQPKRSSLAQNSLKFRFSRCSIHSHKKIYTLYSLWTVWSKRFEIFSESKSLKSLKSWNEKPGISTVFEAKTDAAALQISPLAALNSFQSFRLAKVQRSGTVRPFADVAEFPHRPLRSVTRLHRTPSSDSELQSPKMMTEYYLVNSI